MEHPPGPDRYSSNVPKAIRSQRGISLIAIIGVLAVISIGLSLVAPGLVQIWDRRHEETEVQHLRRVAEGIQTYLEQDKAFPPSLGSLSPDYLPFPSAQLTKNERGYPRYYFVHPNMSSFDDAAGLSSSALPDARVLLISNLTRDESPTITNASEFETWWATDESTTPGLHIHRSNMGFLFHLLTIDQDGDGGSYQVNGTGTDSGGGTLALHTNYHLTGTSIKFDEADSYVSSEVQFALTTNTAYWFDPNCTVGKQWNPLDPDCDSGGVLWLSTKGPSAGTPGITWNESQTVAFDNPNLTYQNGPASNTDGTFASVLDMDDFTTLSDVDGIHYVTQNITVGSASTIDLFVGDVLLSLDTDHTLTSTNSLTVDDNDVFIFRPDTAGDYSAGTFIMLIDESDINYGSIVGVSLVETTTSVGGTTVNAGDFLLSEASSNVGDINRFVPNNIGTTTSGTITMLVDGSDINIDDPNEIKGIHLVTSGVPVGDVNLTAGQILTTLGTPDSTTGDNSISIDDSDIFILDVTTAGSNTVANATLFLDGSDVSLDSGDEDVDGIALETQAPAPPYTFLDQFNAVAYTGNDGTQNYSNDWQEIGEADGPTNGIVEVDTGGDCVSGNCIRMRGRDDEDLNGVGLSREADLTGKTTATLTFSYKRGRVDVPPDPGSITLAVSSNGGASWTDLQTYVMNAEDGSQVPQSFDITSYIASNTQIRFMGTVSNVDEVRFYVDNIEITAN